MAKQNILYPSSDQKRELDEEGQNYYPEDNWQKDCRRLIHSPSFRRLQEKTQLFPGWDFDYFRNRLTHSIEVARIAKAIARKINNNPRFKTNPISLDLVEFAALAHDLGQPPFGHEGERTLNGLMKKYGGFESNAQTLRILTTLEKTIPHFRDWTFENETLKFVSSSGSKIEKTIGLNLTYRSLAALIKTDKKIPCVSNSAELNKGFYYHEEGLVKRVKCQLMGGATFPLKTIECQIMDIADDISNAVYDLDDALKAGFMSILDLIVNKRLRLRVVEGLFKESSKKGGKRKSKDELNNEILETMKDLFWQTFKFEIDTSRFSAGNGTKLEIGKNDFLTIVQEENFKFLISAFSAGNKTSFVGFFRNELTSGLVEKFIKGVSPNPSKEDRKKLPLKFWKIEPDPETDKQINFLKRFVFEAQTSSPRVKRADFRGRQIITGIFRALEKNPELMAEDFYSYYEKASSSGDVSGKKRAICDYIAGMTDSFANRFYAKLFSESPETVFRPVD